MLTKSMIFLLLSIIHNRMTILNIRKNKIHLKWVEFTIGSLTFCFCAVQWWLIEVLRGWGGDLERDGERDRRGRQWSEKGSDECNGSSAMSIHTQHALTKEKQSRNGLKLNKYRTEQ